MVKIKRFYTEWLPWFYLWIIASLVYMVYVIWSILEHSKVDPSAGAVLGFLPFIIPIFFVETAFYIAPVMLLVKLVKFIFFLGTKWNTHK